MRQLVTIVRDGTLLVFTHDGDDVQQVAQLVDPGLGVRDVVGLGVTIGALYEPKPRRAPQPARTLPAASGETSSTSTTPKRSRAPQTPSGITDADVLAFVGAHPGCTAPQIAAGLGLTAQARKALEMRLWKLRNHGRLGSTKTPGVSRSGSKVELRIYQPITPEGDIS